ncbi:MAG: hypothetical protein ACC628_16290, partial [Pirellulaceae bacterium]
GPVQKYGGPVQKYGGPTQKSYGLWAPKHGPSCAPTHIKGCGSPKGCGHNHGLFGWRHAGHGYGHGYGSYGKVVQYGKGGCTSCGGGMKYDYGAPAQQDVPGEVIEESGVPTPAPIIPPAPIVPPAPEKSARRSYSLLK